jgi:hypothetical protein
VAFAAGLGEAVQESGAFAGAHQLPGFVDDDEAAWGPAGDRLVDLPPDVVQGEQGAGRADLVGQVAQRPDDQVAVRAGGGGAGEQVGVGAVHPGGEPGGQGGGGRVRVRGQRGAQVAQQRCRLVVGGRIRGDAGGPVDGEDGPVEGGVLARGRPLADQHADEGVQEQPAPCEHVRTGVTGRQVEGVDADAGGAEPDQGAADRAGQA